MVVTLNLPTVSFQNSVAFYTSIGFVDAGSRATLPRHLAATGYHPVLVWGDTFALILHTHSQWHALFQTPVPIHNAFGSISHAVALPVDSVEELNKLCMAGSSMGGRLDQTAIINDDTTYMRRIYDPDGRLWTLSASKIAAAPKTTATATGVVQQEGRPSRTAPFVQMFSAGSSLASAILNAQSGNPQSFQ